jgi:hypothetical protein
LPLRALVLLDLEHRLESFGFTLVDKGLELSATERRAGDAALLAVTGQREPRLIQDELAYNQADEARAATATYDKAIGSQRALLTRVRTALDNNERLAVFTDAPGGAGKTFCFNGLLSYVRGNGDIALGVASSGIAALLLGLGRTFHSRFRASLQPQEGQTLNIPVNTALAQLI